MFVVISNKVISIHVDMEPEVKQQRENKNNESKICHELRLTTPLLLYSLWLRFDCKYVLIFMYVLTQKPTTKKNKNKSFIPP